MQAVQANVFTRDDTFFGVCEALGEDFRFNPVFLRAALGIGLLWNPLAMLGIYAALGLAVAVTRWLVPNPRAAKASADEPVNEGALPASDNDAEPLAAAA